MKLKSALLAAVTAVGVSPAAHAYEGLYGAIGAGLSYNQPDLDLEGLGPVEFDGDADYDNGIGIYTSLGYAFPSNWRVELEFSYRENDLRFISSEDARASNFNPIDGGLEAYSGHVNLLYDFDTGTVVTPFVGVGAGVTGFSLDATSSTVDPIGGFNLNVDDGANFRLSAQAIAGVSVELAENLALDLSYRYLAALRDPDFFQADGQQLKAQFRNHSAFAGLRWNFGAPAAAAPAVQYKDCWDGSSVPVTVDCPPEIVETTTAIAEPINFVVYFDYDKSNLTPEAANLVSEAADRALADDIETVVVSGNTDSAGGAAYNQRLSERRASVVRDALIANGVPADRIRTEANGENNPAKPTPDGTREPLNRRTEVSISFENASS